MISLCNVAPSLGLKPIGGVSPTVLIPFIIDSSDHVFGNSVLLFFIFETSPSGNPFTYFTFTVPSGLVFIISTAKLGLSLFTILGECPPR